MTLKEHQCFSFQNESDSEASSRGCFAGIMKGIKRQGRANRGKLSARKSFPLIWRVAPLSKDLDSPVTSRGPPGSNLISFTSAYKWRPWNHGARFPAAAAKASAMVTREAALCQELLKA